MLPDETSPKVCFISRGRRGGTGRLTTDYGVMPNGFDGPKIRVHVPDNGDPWISAESCVPVEYLQAINEYERKKHSCMDWPEWLGTKPEFTPPIPGVGFVPCYSVSPYGSFI